MRGDYEDDDYGEYHHLECGCVATGGYGEGSF
jgi:hypothetical protein